jgi:hypothetical protein
MVRLHDRVGGDRADGAEHANEGRVNEAQRFSPALTCSLPQN